MLNVLHIEDNPSDSRLLQRYLQQQEIAAQCRRVETRDELQEALAAHPWDVVLSDYNVPGLDFQEALTLVRSTLPDTPFILVSGSVGEMTAVTLLKDGVWDFVLKDNLTRLKSAIERALRDRQHQHAQRAAEQALQESETRLSLALDAAQMGVWEWDVNTDLVLYTPKCYSIFGLPPGNGKESLASFQRLVHPDDLPLVMNAAEQAMQTRITYTCEFRILPPGGEMRWLYEVGRFTYDDAGRPLRLVGTSQDITGKKMAEVALRESEERFRLIAETVSEVFWMADIEMERIYYVSPAYERIWQRSCASLYANPRSYLAAIHPDDKERVIANLNASEPIGVPFEHEYRVVRPDGSLCWVWDRGFPVVAPGGQATRYVGVARDITARKTDEQELQRYRENLEELVEARTAALRDVEERFHLFMDNSPAVTWIKDEEGRHIFLSKTYQKRFGVRLDEWLGKTDFEVWPASIAATFRENDKAVLAAGHPIEITEQTPEPDGSTCYWHSIKIPFQDATGKRFIGGIGIDITVRKSLEDAREAARRDAERFARIKSEFLANMSHEIRTPLNGVLGLARIGYRDCDGRKVREMFSRILDSGQLLMGIINDILDFSKIEAGKLVIEAVPVELPRLIDHSVGLLLERAQAKGISLTFDMDADLPTTCMGDPLRIGQILINLISNAVKFTEQGNITLSVARLGTTLILCVVDTGIGMSEEQLDKLFTPFEQADGSTTRRFGGTGLGLTITKRLVELMGGEIHVACKPAVGCTFEVRLPFEPVESSTAPLGDAAPECVAATDCQRLAGISILAAEDNEINRFVLEDLLVSEGARVILVENGRQAVEQVAGNGGDFDIVLMDVQMPEMDGFEATRRIRELAPGLPVIGQTAHAMAEERNKCLAAGMIDHIAKPIDPEHLYRTLLKWLGARSNAVPPRDNPALPEASPWFDAGLADPAIIDLRVLAERFRNDNVKVKLFAEKFLDNTARSLAQLEEALSREDLATLNTIGHRDKSAAQTVGALRFAEICRQLEAHQPGDSFGDAVTAVRELHRLHNSISVRMSAIAPAPDSNGDHHD